MYVRVKTTPNSPRKSVQIVKSVRKGDKICQKIIRHIGIARDEQELQQLKDLAQSIKFKIKNGDQLPIFSPEEVDKLRNDNNQDKYKDEDYQTDVRNLQEEQRTVTGIHDIYGTFFDRLGFDKVFKNPARNKSSISILRDIVLARLANPLSKLASVNMLADDFGITINLNRVYQVMDKLDDNVIDKIKDIAYRNTAELFQEKIDVIFFDCTTLYFESFFEDDLRKNGYSKDLKFNQPQVLFALMVTKEGLPVGYEIFEGSFYEGHTLVPIVKKLREKYQIEKFIVVADAGMSNEANFKELEASNLKFILGCRLKNLPNNLKAAILNKENYKLRSSDGAYKTAEFIHNGRKIVVSYSEKRAKKDQYDRAKNIEKLRKKLAKKDNPKEYLSNYGNKKYLALEGKSRLIVNEEKIREAEAWDGLCGVITNVESFTNQEILTQYKNLWQVENAFRINKHDLKIRPIYHYKPERVKAHLAISFIAYTLVKHLEYLVKLQYKKMSPEKIRKCLLQVQTSINYDKVKKIRYGFPSSISLDARKIYKLANCNYKLTPYIIKKM